MDWTLKSRDTKHPLKGPYHEKIKYANNIELIFLISKISTFF